MSRPAAIALSVVVAVLLAIVLFRGSGPPPPPEAESPRAGAAAPGERRSGSAPSAGRRPEGPAAGGMAERRAPRREQARPSRDLQPPAFPPQGQGRVAEPDDPQNLKDLQRLIHTATKDPDPTERAAAISDLALREDIANVLPVFYEVAKDKDPDVKLAVVTALGELGEAAPIDLVAQYASDPDPEIRLETLSVVESLAEEESTARAVEPILNRATRDPDADVRDKAQEIVEQLSGTSDADDE